MAQKEKHLIAHVGMGKTGTSAIQTALALGVETLKSHGIIYPDHPSIEKARVGMISSGNVNRETFFETCRDELEKCDPGETVLVSNEWLFRTFHEDMSQLTCILRHADRVKLILYLRDPLSQALSAYGQSVKRGGMTAPVSDFLETAGSLSHVIEFLELLNALPVLVEIVNYSRHEDRHIARFGQALGLDDDALSLPAGKRVNRSLTRAELYFQRRLNSHAENLRAANISDNLCNELPDISAEIPHFSAATYHSFVEAQRPWVEKLNALIPADEALALPRYDEVVPNFAAQEDDPLEFSKAQIDVVARTLMERIPSQFDRQDARKLAARIRPGDQLSESDVAVLLDMATALLPQAEGLRRKRDKLRSNFAGTSEKSARARDV